MKCICGRFPRQIEELGLFLAGHGVEILSTGGTATCAASLSPNNLTLRSMMLLLAHAATLLSSLTQFHIHSLDYNFLEPTAAEYFADAIATMPTLATLRCAAQCYKPHHG